MLAFVIQNHSHRAGADLGRELVGRLACHGSTFSGVGASDQPGAVHIREAERSVVQRFVPLTLDDESDADAPSCAPVLLRGENVGLVTSGGWSFTLNKSVALAYVRSDLATPGTKVEIEVFGERRTATVGREPLYDPENARLRA